MSQFRETGVYYVSEWGGNSSNPGTDVSPFSHPADYGTSGQVNVGILGSGVYNGIWSGIRNLKGDGKVIIDGNGLNKADSNTFENLYVRNFNNLFNTGGGTNPRAINCIFEQITALGLHNAASESFFYGNVYIGNIIQSRTSGFNFLINSLILGEFSGGRIDSVKYSFIAKNGYIVINAANVFSFIHNMVNGRIYNTANATFYESKRLFDGSVRPDANPLIADIIDILPNFYTDGNFSGDAKFIDVISRTVEPNSDLLRKSNANGFIGYVKPGQYISFDNSDFLITFQNIDTSNPDLLRIADGFDFGKIRITGKVSDTLISSQAVDIRIPFFFDSSEPGGDPLNNNVPDAVHGLRGLDTLGDLPYRLRFEVRSSQMPNASRFNNDEWDNDISGIAGRWYLMEYGQPMLHHIVASVAYGNADKFAINSPTKVPFNYRSLDIEITLSNNRSQV